MWNINISGFADEISSDIKEQFEGFNDIGIKYFEPRNISGKSIADLDRNEAKELKGKLDNLNVVLTIKCGENGKTFGSVSNKEIADKLNDMGYNIDKKKIDFAPVKGLGLYTVKIKLHPSVTATINVEIKPL